MGRGYSALGSIRCICELYTFDFLTAASCCGSGLLSSPTSCCHFLLFDPYFSITHFYLYTSLTNFSNVAMALMFSTRLIRLPHIFATAFHALSSICTPCATTQQPESKAPANTSSQDLHPWHLLRHLHRRLEKRVHTPAHGTLSPERGLTFPTRRTVAGLLDFKNLGLQYVRYAQGNPSTAHPPKCSHIVLSSPSTAHPSK